MKFNLKNRPKPERPEKAEGLIEWWFEGFEKELKEILEFARNAGDFHTVAIIKEILGES